MELVFGEYKVSDDKALLSIFRIKELLAGTYWASDRTEEIIGVSIESSDCYGVYLEGEMVGFARVVSDNATMFWLCDVVIAEAHRGKGLGKRLVESVVCSDKYRNIRGILATRDAHGLYEGFGFGKAEEGRFMMKPLYRS